jgi:hypothetical protein
MLKVKHSVTIKQYYDAHDTNDCTQLTMNFNLGDTLSEVTLHLCSPDSRFILDANEWISSETPWVAYRQLIKRKHALVSEYIQDNNLEFLCLK